MQVKTLVIAQQEQQAGRKECIKEELHSINILSAEKSNHPFCWLRHVKCINFFCNLLDYAEIAKSYTKKNIYVMSVLLVYTNDFAPDSSSSLHMTHQAKTINHHYATNSKPAFSSFH